MTTGQWRADTATGETRRGGDGRKHAGTAAAARVPVRSEHPLRRNQPRAIPHLVPLELGAHLLLLALWLRVGINIPIITAIKAQIIILPAPSPWEPQIFPNETQQIFLEPSHGRSSGTLTRARDRRRVPRPSKCGTYTPVLVRRRLIRQRSRAGYQAPSGEASSGRTCQRLPRQAGGPSARAPTLTSGAERGTRLRAWLQWIGRVSAPLPGPPRSKRCRGRWAGASGRTAESLV